MSTFAEELRDFARFLLNIAMEFFFGGWAPDKDVSKKFEKYSDWLYQVPKAYTYNYSVDSVTSYLIDF